eukprot:2641593-Prymnesium_polylepis.1
MSHWSGYTKPADWSFFYPTNQANGPRAQAERAHVRASRSEVTSLAWWPAHPSATWSSRRYVQI